MPERVVTSVHIEKTAGLALFAFYEKALGEENVGYYDSNRNTIARASDLFIHPSSQLIDKVWVRVRSSSVWPRLRETSAYNPRKSPPSVIPHDVSLIHGHFNADYFDNILFDQLRTVVVREPLDRMRSQFDHWKSVKGYTGWRKNVPFDPKIKFEDYALLPELKNFQVEAICRKDLSEFEVVGVTENLAGYTSDLWRALVDEGIATGQKPVFVERRNVTRQVHRTNILDIGREFIDEFQRYHNDDYLLFRGVQMRVGEFVPLANGR